MGFQLVEPIAISQQVVPQLASLSEQLGLAEYANFLAQLETLSIAYVIQALRKLGWEFVTKQQFTLAELNQQLNIKPCYHRLLSRLFDMLAEVGIVRRITNAHSIGSPSTSSGNEEQARWEVIQVPAVLDPQTVITTLAIQYPTAQTELTLFSRCARELAAVLQGRCDPLTLLFPKGDPTTATQLYQDSLGSHWVNSLVKQVIAAALGDSLRQAQGTQTGNSLRILEIGAGTGGTTVHVLPQLPNQHTEYVFTDVSPLFLAHAKKQFCAYPFVTYKVLDIEKSLEKQGFTAQHDIVIAANVLHATQDITNTMQNVQQLLVPNGLFILLEGTTPQRWLELIFGLTEGWWKFNDAPLRTTTPLLSVAQWSQVLEKTGFTSVIAIPPADESLPIKEQTVLVAQKAHHFPLSEAQRQLWILSKLEEVGSLAYNVCTSLELRGNLNVSAMQQAVQYLVNRHEALRTAFSQNGDYQAVSSRITIDVPLLEYLNNQDFENWFVTVSHEPFNLAQAPLLRVCLVKRAEQQHLLIVTVHHIIADGWSMSVILQDLIALYSALVAGNTPHLAMSMQFSTYTAWQQQQLSTPAVAKHADYWLKHLSDELPSLDLPLDHLRPALKTFTGGRQTLDLTADLTQASKQIGKKQGCTLFMLLLSVYTALLHRLSGQNDIIIGIPTSGRSLKDSDNLIGYCTHLLPIRSTIEGNPHFNDYLKFIRKTLLTAYVHQEYPYANLLNALNLKTDASRTPLVTVIFNLDRPMSMPKLSDLTAEIVSLPVQYVAFDLSFSLLELEEGLRIDCDYNRDLFDANTIKHWLGYFQTLLESVIAEPTQPLFDLPLLATAQQQQLLSDWNNTAVTYPQDKCLHQLFEAQVEKTPQATAVIFEQTQLTYQELNQRANQLAHYLQMVGVTVESLVGVCMERSIEMVVSLLAILKAGGAYLPLDPDYPPERLAFMLQDAQVPVLLIQERLLSLRHFDKLNAPQAQGTENFFRQAQGTVTTIVCVDSEWQTIAQQSVANLVTQTTLDNLAYVIYTSGSTGMPKGAALPHRAICNHMLWMQTTFPLDETDKVLQKTPFSFDASVWEFYAPLLAGAQLVMARPEGHQDPAYLVKIIINQRITIFQSVPSLLRLLSEEPAFPQCHSLRRIFCGGEELSVALQERCLSLLKVELCNLYGPTEACIDAAFYVCSRTSNYHKVPIGKPISNTQLYILDRYLHPVPIGVAGELHVGGVGLARGYLNRPDLTVEKFIATNLGRLYKTGDLARYLPDGNIEYLGRIDNQVKLRGFRIELGEIEAIFSKHPVIQDKVVLIRTDISDNKQIVAYIVFKTGQTVTVPELRTFLSQHLPDYMLPAAYIVLEKLPLSPNGKIDRRALPAPDKTSTTTQYVAPHNDTETTLAALWAEVLGRASIGIHDNFFELGGHSLQAIQIMGRIRTTFAIELPVRRLFETLTIAELATVIEQVQPANPTHAPQAIPRAARRTQPAKSN